MKGQWIPTRLWRGVTPGEFVLRLAGLAIMLVIIIPVVAILVGTLRTDSPGVAGATWTLANLQVVYGTTEFLKPLFNTLYVAFAVTILATAMGTVLAWLVARSDLPFKTGIELMVVMPMFLSHFTSALAWIMLASPYSGFLNVLGRWLGLKQPLFNIYSVSGIIWVLTVAFVPYAYLLIVGALRTMDPSMEEASNMLGGGLLTTIRRVTLPLAMPAIISSSLLIFVLASEAFTVPAVLGPDIRYFNLLYKVYTNISQYPPSYPMAAAASTLLLWITFGGMYLYQRMVRQTGRFITITARGYRPLEIRLGRWKWVGLAIVGLYSFVTVVLPFSVLVLASFLPFVSRNLKASMFTLDNYRIILDNARTVSSITNTLWLAFASATICVAIGVVLGYLIYRTRTPGRRAMEYVGMMPLTIPGMILAVGVLWAYIDIPFPIYGTILMLLVAFVTRYLGYGLRGISSGLLQIDRSLEEAATIAGASVLRVMRDVTIRLLLPAILGTWMLIFIVVVREVEMALLLYTPTASVISVLMWDYLHGAEFTVAAALGVLQTALILLVLYVAKKVLKVQVRAF